MFFSVRVHDLCNEIGSGSMAQMVVVAVIAERRPEVFMWGSNCQLTDGLIWRDETGSGWDELVRLVTSDPRGC